MLQVHGKDHVLICAFAASVDGDKHEAAVLLMEPAAEVFAANYNGNFLLVRLNDCVGFPVK